MNIITKTFLRFGVYSSVSFLSAIAVLNGVVRVGSIVIILIIFSYIASDTLRMTIEESEFLGSFKESLRRACISNFVDLSMFALFLIIGVYSAL